MSFDLPLTQTLSRLRVESQKRDPDGIGVNFMSIRLVGPGDKSQATIKIAPPLKNIRLIDS